MAQTSRVLNLAERKPCRVTRNCLCDHKIEFDKRRQRGTQNLSGPRMATLVCETLQDMQLTQSLFCAGASELAVSTLRHLIRPFGPSTVWQTIYGKRHTW